MTYLRLPYEKCEICDGAVRSFPTYNFKRCVVSKSLYSRPELFLCCFLFSATPSKHKTFALCLQNVLSNICEMLLKILIDIKMFSLEIITITLLIIFELLFSKHFEIGLNNNAK